MSVILCELFNYGVLYDIKSSHLDVECTCKALMSMTCKALMSMRHSLEPEYIKYVKGYEFLSFARNFGDKYGKKLMNTAIKTGTNFNSKYGKKLADTAIKTGKDFATIAGKKMIHKSAEATGDLTGNKIADKITSIDRSKELGPAVKPKSIKENDETNIMEETQEIYIPLEKRKQIVKNLKLF